MKKGVRFNEKKRKFSFDKKESSINNRFNTQRILSVRKMNRLEKSNRDINKEIDEYFSCPDKYFQKNSPVTVGKKIYLLDMNDPRLRRGKKLKTEKKMTNNLFNNLVNYNSNLAYKMSKNNLLNTSISSNLRKKEFQYNMDISSKFEIIDNDRLKMIFNSYKKKDKKDNSSIDKSQLSSISDSFRKNSTQEKEKVQKAIINPSSSMDNVPKDIKNTLLLQSKKLNLQKLSERKYTKMSKYLSKRLNKPQSNLLLNRIDSFRFKKEIINEIENNKPLDELYGKYKWNISLRRPDHFQGVRDSYINLKEDRFMPFWSIVIEKYPKQKELCIKPGRILNESEIKEFKGKNNKLSYGNKNQYFRTVENLEDLSIEGKNLYNLEYKREIIDSKNKKILHKVFVENGKAISSTDINNLYGNDTFYKDYSGCETEKNVKIKKKFDSSQL